MGKSLPVQSAVMRAHADENTIANRGRIADGALIVMTELRANGPLSVSACLPDHAHLGVMLEQTGGRCEKRLQSNRRRRTKPSAHEVNFAPPGVMLWTESDQVVCCRSISLLFDPVELVSQAHGDAMWTMPDEPWLGLPSEPIARLMRLLARDFEVQDRLGELYTDSLIVAISSQLRRRFSSRERPYTAVGLSTAELKRVLEFIEDNLSEPIRLRDIVKLTGMSQSSFVAAFKRSTGLPPHRFQLDARVRRAQARMLAHPDEPLVDVAHRFGFADQAHFGRIFRNLVGESPRAWLKNRRA